LRPKIAASITAGSRGQAIRDIEVAEDAGADLVEIRLDHLKDRRNLRDIANSTLLPTIATNRSVRQGGRFSGTEAERLDVLRYAAASGFKYADVELGRQSARLADEMLAIGVRPIISRHFPEGTPSLAQLRQTLRRARAVDGAVFKIVTRARRASDNIPCLRLVAERVRGLDLVCFAMGSLGTPSRVLSPLLGGYFTFASVRRGGEAAPGQLTVAEMRSIYAMMGWAE